MRVYIHKITKRALEQEPDLFDFTSAIRSAWYWPTKEDAERASRVFSEIGIRIELSVGECGQCSDYRVEQRPEGGFAVSCEHPFSDDPLNSEGRAPVPPGP
jgi:hypothetical protein